MRCLLSRIWLPVTKEKVFSLLIASSTLSTLASEMPYPGDRKEEAIVQP